MIKKVVIIAIIVITIKHSLQKQKHLKRKIQYHLILNKIQKLKKKQLKIGQRKKTTQQLLVVQIKVKK